MGEIYLHVCEREKIGALVDATRVMNANSPTTGPLRRHVEAFLADGCPSVWLGRVELASVSAFPGIFTPLPLDTLLVRLAPTLFQLTDAICAELRSVSKDPALDAFLTRYATAPAVLVDWGK